MQAATAPLLPQPDYRAFMPPSRKNWFRTPCPEPPRKGENSGRAALIAIAAAARAYIAITVTTELPRPLAAIIRPTRRQRRQKSKRYPNPNPRHQHFPCMSACYDIISRKIPTDHQWIATGRNYICSFQEKW